MKHFLLALLWLCSARSLVGHYYSAEAATEAEAKDAALKACQANAFVCYSTGCDQVSDTFFEGETGDASDGPKPLVVDEE